VPQIVSLLPTAPAMPAGAPAPVLAQPTSAVAPGTLLPPDLTSPNFLAQFKAALKTIANVVVQPQLTLRPATDANATAPLMSPVSEETDAAPRAADAEKPVDARMPDLLAELGFAVVPPVFPIPAPAPPVVATGTASAPAAPERIAPALVPQSTAPRSTPPLATSGSVIVRPAPVQPQVQAPAAPDGQTAPALPDPKLVQALPNAPIIETLPDAVRSRALPMAPVPHARPDAKLGQALADLQLGQPLPDVLSQALPPVHLQTAPVTHQPITHLKPSDQPQSPTSAPTLAPAVMLPPTSVATPAAPVATSTPQIGLVQAASPDGSAAQSNNASSDRDQHAPDKVASPASEVTTVQSVPASDAAMVAAAATTVNAAPLTVPVSPSQVVSQIARHADVIRLPGNRGLHIQLHPDDLGGLQVTVRYAPGGGVELHINAEHAATGALVQAGWTELRDALASHGISADRLMLSITTPTGAGQADLSGGGSNRSDPNSANSSQASLSSPDSQSQGQSRQDNAQQRTSQTWKGGIEPLASTDDNPRVASASPGHSRIDYRV
jgi:flagellar hook-length control protein FliK